MVREDRFKELVRCYRSLYRMAQLGNMSPDVIKGTEDTAKQIEEELGLNNQDYARE
jgi:hypothetical protein